MPLPGVFPSSYQPCILTRRAKFRQHMCRWMIPLLLAPHQPHTEAVLLPPLVSHCYEYLCKWVFSSGPRRDNSPADGPSQMEKLCLSKPSSIWEQHQYTINHFTQFTQSREKWILSQILQRLRHNLRFNSLTPRAFLRAVCSFCRATCSNHTEGGGHFMS